MSKVLSAAEAQEQQAEQQAALMQGATRAAQALAGTTRLLSTNQQSKICQREADGVTYSRQKWSIPAHLSFPACYLMSMETHIIRGNMLKS